MSEQTTFISAERLRELPLERKLKMQEAREAIINRLAPTMSAGIDLDLFLRAITSELGRMMKVDRCDVIQMTSQGKLRISHEWRADETVPSSLDTMIDFGQIGEQINLSQPIRLDNTDLLSLDPKFRQLAHNLGTRSLLVVPVVLNGDVLGLLGLHMTRARREWLDEEVQFLESIARQIAIGYQYARLYTDKQREAERTHALLEIANALNARSDVNEVTSLVLERAVSLVAADYGALGVVDADGARISLAAFQTAPHVQTQITEGVRGLIEAHGQSIDITEFPAITKLITEGKTLRLVDTDLPAPLRFVFNATMGGRAALVAPVHIKEQTFGLLGLVWSEPRERFDENEVALIEAVADQIGTALERDQLTAEVMRLKNVLHERHREDRIIGQSPVIRRAIELALNVADTQTSVLLQGESGTGKELLANLIHYNSQRKAKPYIKLNCGAIPETLLESELFGHEKGAFTDARSRRQGRFEEADGGTLFLDEIGEMSLSAQVKLLRVLQDGELSPVGGNQVIKTDVRVIAATNTDLEQEIEQGRFRRDLFYRLSVFPIRLPALRERRTDIHPLVIHFIEHYKQKTGRFISGITRRALDALINYDWLGNVRELENAIERAVIIASGRAIDLEDLPEAVARCASPHLLHQTKQAKRLESVGDEDVIKLEIDVPATMDEIEREAIEATLRYTSGDKSRAARTLGIGRKTLYRKLDGYRQSAGEKNAQD